MLILGIDTSTKLCSVALYSTEKGILGEMNIVVAKNHSHIILPLVDQLFHMTERNIDQVERIAVGMGPGSFTGIRVGMAIAKGMAIGKGIQVVGISGLEALAFACRKEERVFSLIDARKGRVYYQVFDGKRALCEAKDGRIEEVLQEYKGVGAHYFIGDGALAYQETIREFYDDKAIIVSEEQSMLRALYFAQASCGKEGSNLYTLEPLYVCKSQAEKSKK